MNYKVDMSIVMKHCNISTYISMVRNEIIAGHGLVEVRDTAGNQSGIYAAGTHNYFKGLVWVPTSALKRCGE